MSILSRLKEWKENRNKVYFPIIPGIDDDIEYEFTNRGNAVKSLRSIKENKKY